MSSSSSARPSSQPTPQPRQQWEVAVLTARLPAQMVSLVIAALLAPGPTGVYAQPRREWARRYDEQVMRRAEVERVRELLGAELRQARSLVWTPLVDLCRLKRNAPLAGHAARLAQLCWELERRPGVRAAKEVQRATRAGT